MRKFYLFLLAIFLFNTVNAQDSGDVELGLGAGVNISNIVGKNVSSDSKVGFNVGVTADYYFSDTWSLKGRLIYDNKGGKSTNSDNKINLNYLTVPVMANWHFGGNRNFYLNFGPYVGFLMSAKNSESNTDIKKAFKGTDFGLAYGIGYKFDLDTMKLFIEYEAQSGFLGVFESSQVVTLRNGRSSVNVGLLFPL